MPFGELDLKDIITFTIFIVTVAIAWVRLRFRIDRNDEIHKDIKSILLDMAADVVTIKTDVAVIKNEQENFNRRLEVIENAP